MNTNGDSGILTLMVIVAYDINGDSGLWLMTLSYIIVIVIGNKSDRVIWTLMVIVWTLWW